MFKVSYFFEVLPIIASKVNITFELTIAATIFALIVGVIIAIIGYYKIPVLYQLTRVYVSIMRGTPVVAQLYFFYYGIALYSAFVRNMTPLIAVAVVMSFNMGAFMSESIRGALLSVEERSCIFTGNDEFSAGYENRNSTGCTCGITAAF